MLGGINLVMFALGALIYWGHLSIDWRDGYEYLLILNVVGYFATFSLDFKKKYMGVDID